MFGRLGGAEVSAGLEQQHPSAGSSLRRAASVAPAEPPPMMIVSYSCSITSGHFCCLRGRYRQEN